MKTESMTGPLGNSHLHEFYVGFFFFFLMSQKNSVRILLEIMLNVYLALCSIVILTILSFST